MNDTISRQAAINAHCELCVDRGKCNCDICPDVEVFQLLPSAQQEEVIPHRNYKYFSDYWCECGWHLGKKGEVKYCSNCGRKVNWDE